MSRRIVGALTTPGGTAQGGTLRFVSLGEPVPFQSSYSEQVLTGTGGYDITLADGSYRVEIKTDKRFYPIGDIVISPGSDTDLNSLLIG